MFNIYKNRHNQNVPKSAIIANDEDVRNYLKEHYKWTYSMSYSTIDKKDPWLIVQISVSAAGNIYMHIFTVTDDDIVRYDPSKVKDFTEFDAFKRYLNWARKLPKKLVNKK